MSAAPHRNAKGLSFRSPESSIVSLDQLSQATIQISYDDPLLQLVQNEVSRTWTGYGVGARRLPGAFGGRSDPRCPLVSREQADCLQSRSPNYSRDRVVPGTAALAVKVAKALEQRSDLAVLSWVRVTRVAGPTETVVFRQVLESWDCEGSIYNSPLPLTARKQYCTHPTVTSTQGGHRGSGLYDSQSRLQPSGVFRDFEEIYVHGTLPAPLASELVSRSSEDAVGGGAPVIFGRVRLGALCAGRYRICVGLSMPTVSRSRSRMTVCGSFLVLPAIGCDAEREEVNTSGVYTLREADGSASLVDGVPLQGQAYWTDYVPSGVVMFTHGAFTSGPSGYSDEEFFAIQYDYLMRCLAQQGFVALSVRSGSGSDPTSRANVMLSHLARIHEIADDSGFALDEDTPLAFAGHSRGGQAAAIAASAVVAGSIPGFSRVAAVVCLAPSAQDDAPSPKAGAFDSYLSIAGTHDGDVDSAKSLLQFEMVDPFIPYKGFVWVHRANHSGFTESVSYVVGDSNIAVAVSEDEALPREVQHAMTQEVVGMFLRWRMLGHDEYREVFTGSSLRGVIGPLLPEESASDFRAYVHFTEDWATNPACDNGCYFVGFLDVQPPRKPFDELDSSCRSKREGFRLMWDTDGSLDPMMILDLVAGATYYDGSGPLIPNSASAIEFELAKVVQSSIANNTYETVVHVSLWAAKDGDPWGEVSTVSVAAPASRRIPAPSDDLSSSVPATLRIAIDAFGGSDFRSRVQAIVLTFLDARGDMLVTRPRFF